MGTALDTALSVVAAVVVVILVAIAAGFLLDPDPKLTPGARVFGLVLALGLAVVIVVGRWV